MPTTSYTIICTRKTALADGVYEVAFSKPEGFTFTPGQFILFDVPLVENLSDIQPRALSIASSPDEPELLFVLKMLPGGRASRWFEELVEPGTPAVMKGPFGLFVLDRQTTKEYLFVATSTGVAPFRSQLLWALNQGDRRRMDLVFGVRSESDLFWQDEFGAIAKRYDNFFLHLSLSNPAGEWTGHRGRVQTLVPLIVQDFSVKNLYVCGSPDMTKEIKQLALGEWGVAKEDFHMEGYI